jgi:hypothetical protein
MTSMKKAYEKEQINLEEFLKSIRYLASKECKTIIRKQKLRDAMSQNM